MATFRPCFSNINKKTIDKLEKIINFVISYMSFKILLRNRGI